MPERRQPFADVTCGDAVRTDRVTMFAQLPFFAQLCIFVASAAIIWIAGGYLSDSTSVLSDRLHLGDALGGLILLAIATNLPELAITLSAATSGQLDVAVSNILGGIAVQTVVLVALDAFGVRERRPLTYQAASLTLVLEGAVVVAVLAVVVMGTQFPTSFVFLRLSPDVAFIAVIWIVGLTLTQRAASGLPWNDGGKAPDRAAQPGARDATTRVPWNTNTAVLVFAGSAFATLLAGVFAEVAGTAAAARIGMSGTVFGATVLAVATSLPELSTGLTATREGKYELAFGDIFGGNAFLPVLFLLATIVSGKAVLPNAHHSDLYLTALGALLTVVYMVGLIFRPSRQFARMGIDSIVVLFLYVVGIAGLVALGDR